MPHSDRLLLLYALLLGEGQLVDFDLIQPVRAFQQLIHVYHRLQEHAASVNHPGSISKDMTGWQKRLNAQTWLPLMSMRTKLGTVFCATML